MPKYLAVIKDSFREALASRVMWMVLLLITLILAAIAPLGYREELTWELGDNDVNEWPDLMELVRTEGQQEGETPAGRIWGLLDAPLQRRLTDVRLPQKDKEPPNPFAFLAVFRDFRRALNKLLERPDFYEEEYFADVRLLSSELRALRDKPPQERSDLEIARFNRLLLEAAFPDLVRGSPPTSIQLLYGWLDFGPSFPLRADTLREYLQSRLTTGMNWLLGGIGVGVAILFTAPIIPQMFDPGSLHLLLSKPVARWLLFLAKFIGGCAFIFIAASYLIGGLWLIVGLRFDIWDPKLLWSVPIYLFVFAIYYSVSALVAVIWRSPIVAVALTILFWVACFVVGTGKTTFENTFWNKSRLIALLRTDEDTLFAVAETGIVQQWEPVGREWQEVFLSKEQQQSRGILLFLPTIPREMRSVGPVYDPEHERLLSAQPTIPPTSLKLYVGERSAEWEAVSNLNAPAGTLELFREPRGSILAVSSMGIFRLRGDPLVRQEPVELFGFKIPLNLGGPFRNVSPEPPVLLTQPAAAAIHPESGELCVYTRGTLTLLRPNSTGSFELGPEKELDGPERQPVVLALAGRSILVGRRDGRVQVHDATTLEVRDEFELAGANQPRFITASPDGRRFAIVFHGGQLWLYDDEEGTLQQPDVAGQGDISAALVESDRLLVVDSTVRVSHYELPSCELIERFSPKLGLLGNGYRYGLLPLYTLFPKPGELNKTFKYLLSGEKTEELQRDDLAAAQRNVDPWAPLWSSAIFVCAMLAIACVYVEWQDF